MAEVQLHSRRAVESGAYLLRDYQVGRAGILTVGSPEHLYTLVSCVWALTLMSGFDPLGSVG